MFYVVSIWRLTAACINITNRPVFGSARHHGHGRHSIRTHPPIFTPSQPQFPIKPDAFPFQFQFLILFVGTVVRLWGKSGTVRRPSLRTGHSPITCPVRRPFSRFPDPTPPTTVYQCISPKGGASKTLDSDLSSKGTVQNRPLQNIETLKQ